MAKPDPAAKTIEAGARYVLITECLQNDFFLNPECRLYLQDEAARRILLAKDDQHAFPTTGAPRWVPENLLDRGPLGLFLQATLGEALAGRRDGLVHVRSEERRVGKECRSRWGADSERKKSRVTESSW